MTKHPSIAPVLILILSVSLGGSVVGAARADDAPAPALPDILSRHLQAEGTNSRPQSAAVRVSGTVETTGQRGVWNALYKAPNKELDQTTIADETDTSGDDGTNAWRRDSNGSVRLLTQEELKDQRTDPEGALRAGVAASHLVLRPQTERRTGDYIVDAIPDGGKPIVIFIDPKTFFIAKTQVQEDEETITTTYDRWQTENGTVKPTRWTISNGDKKYDSVVSVARIERDVDAPDSLFAVPPPTKNYHFLTPGATSATVPFDYNGDKIALAVEVNGVPVHVALDSGAAAIVLAQPLTEMLKLKPQRKFEARGIGGSRGQESVTLDSLTLTDALQFTHLNVASGISVFGSRSHPLTALVGYDLLSRFVVKVDYDAQQLTLTEPDAFQPTPADGKELALELDDDTPSVLAQMDGLPPARFLLDTGAPDTVYLNGPYVDANKLRDHYPLGKGRDVVEGGIAGQAEYDVFRGKSLSLGGITLSGIPVYVPRDAKGGNSQQLAGTLGTEILSRYVVTFDYPHRRLFLTPGANAGKTFDTRTFGIDVIGGIGKDGKLHVYVVHLDQDAPARKEGMKPLDEIVAIDVIPVSTLGLSEVQRLLSVASEQTTHYLSVRSQDGRTHTRTATLYDLLPPAN